MSTNSFIVSILYSVKFPGFLNNFYDAVIFIN